MAITFPRHPFFQAARLERRFPVKKALWFQKIFGGLAIIFFLGFLATDRTVWLGLGLISTALHMFFHLWSRFIRYYERTGLVELPRNDAGNAIDFKNSWPLFIDFATAVFLSGVNDQNDSRELMIRILQSDAGNFFFERTGIPERDFLRELDQAYGSFPREPFDFLDATDAAGILAQKHGHRFLAPADFFGAIGGMSKPFAQVLLGRGISLEDFDYVAHWQSIGLEHRRKTFLETLLSSAGIGKTWAYAYTPFLDRHAETVRVSTKDELHIFAHTKEIRELEEALVKSASANAMVIGEPGVGKMSVVSGLAKKIREGKSLPLLNYRRVMKLVMADVLAEKTFGGVEEKLARLFREAEGAGNVILVIEDIEQYFMPNLATHLTEAMLPFLRSSLIKIIGLTNPEGYERTVAEHSALATLFHPIRVEEPDEETMMAILADATLEQEKRFKSVILYSALRAVYVLSKQFIPDMLFPEKAIVLLEETFIAGRERGLDAIKPDVVSSVLERKFGRAASVVGEKEKEILTHLEDKLHEQIINQEAAIRAIADAMRRKRSGVSSGNKPIGSFLFLGPTGVGKTETAKALARTYFGSEDAMIRLDMSEYQNPQDTHRLIGSRESGDAGYLSEKIRARPFSLVLLDEIEKAHPNITDLFLRILDEGKATDGYGKKLDFTNAFVIATSNAGAELMRESLASGVAYSDVQKKLVDEVLRQGIFRPEFVNRFDAVVVYAPLSGEHVQKVAELMLKGLALRLEQEGYRLFWDSAAVLWLAEHGYSPVFGARELRRVIQENIESKIAKEILEGKYKKGDTISIAPPF